MIPRNSDSLLLVEGQSDKAFFKALAKSLNLSVEIKPPTDLGVKTNTVSRFPDLIRLLVLNEMPKGELKHLGIVADADYLVDGDGGFKKRWSKFTKILEECDYRIPKKPPALAGTGSIFKHAELPDVDVGLWLMPNHQDDGMIEKLILSSANLADPTQKILIPKAKSTVDSIKEPLFSKIHGIKASIYTWLAWQKRPGQTLDILINNPALLDTNAEDFKGLSKWLQDLFS